MARFVGKPITVQRNFTNAILTHLLAASLTTWSVICLVENEDGTLAIFENDTFQELRVTVRVQVVQNEDDKDQHQ